IISRFMQGLSIAPVRRTKLVNIGYVSTDQALTARVANAYAEQYIESYLDAKMEMTTKATSWLTERLGTLKVTLDNSKDKLIKYKEANGLVDVNGSVGRLNEQELLMLTTELAQARTELSSASDVFRQVRSLQSSPELLEAVPAMQLDPLVQRVKIEQGQAQRQLDELLNRYGARHPKVVDAKSQLSTLNATLEGHLRRVAAGIEKDYQLVRQNVATIQAKLAQGKQEIQAIGTKKYGLDAIEREVATNQGLYDTFFNRMSEARSADGLETANARLSDPAVAPNAPFKPKKQLIIALAALASLILSALMALLYEQMDDTIKSTNDVEVKLGVRLLGIFPLIKGGMFKGTRTLPLNPTEIEDPKGTFSESVNTVRTALCLDDGDAPRKIIVVTSSVPGEGKSTVSINLAHSLGQLQRVLLIDGDMRRPTVAKSAGFDKNIPGLSSLITGTASARDCIKRGAFDNSVDILPSGPIPSQPLELLSSKRFEKILGQLGQHYDRIIIDCAPTQAVSDALVLSKLSDAVVYAVKSHDTSMELVKRGLQRLAQVNAKLAGVLITQVDIDRITSYGGDYYYQGYYDYYGYTEKGQKSQRPDKVRLSKEELYQLRTDDSDVQLDLDKPAMDLAAAGGVFHNGVLLADDDPYDNISDHAAEFDLTAQLDEEMQSPIERMRRDRSNFKTAGNQAAGDDLDII
ncbi:MAG: polysaccharide biosynthesis tyrosine autokinase, partial [Granulosicoccaceae bacterium]